MDPDPDVTFTCGICLFNLSVEFTNSLSRLHRVPHTPSHPSVCRSKWKPCPSSPGATSVYQLIRIESFSVYVNKEGRPIIGDQDPEQVPFSVWREDMERGLKQFNTGADPLKFMVQPVSAKVKVIVNRSNEARVPKLLVDFVVEDVSLRLTRDQYGALRRLHDSLRRNRVAWRFRPFRPAGRVGQGGAAAAGTRVMAWWRYALEAVLEQRVRPYTWSRVRRHREVYSRYRDACARALLQPADTELKLDLQQLEDQLDVVDILVAREHAKLKLHRDNPERVAVGARAPSRLARWFSAAGGAGASSYATSGSRSPSPELQVRAERPRGLWAQLSGSERDRLFEAIGYAEGTQRPEKPKQYIEHKLNVTLVNCSLSLVSDAGEVLASHLTHLLASLETRPAASAYKISLRVESAVVEGASLEHHLVPLATANVNSGNNYSNFMAIDIEKNPSKSDADFGLSITMEPMEIVYHEHAVSELLTFFCSKPRPVKDLCLSAGHHLKRALKAAATVGRRALTRRNTYCLSVDVRGPYIVIPESGSMQKGGQVLVLDAGRVVVRTELQPPGVSLEDATQMELEERLYDRLHVECSEAQVLFCDSGDEWWESRKMQDSELHLVPKVRGQVVFSNSVRPEYRALARHKLTVSLSSVKLNLSDRRIGMGLDFLENVPAPTFRRASTHAAQQEDQVEHPDLDPADHVVAGLSGEQLARVRSVVRQAAVRAVRGQAPDDGCTPKLANLEVDKSFMSSDHSDSEELELWARTVDLPGFDDNVSPHNAITMLLRFVIGEVVVNLARSSNRVDKPYLLLRLGKLCWDSALMEYGPAVQASVGSVQLVDRLHAAPGGTGQYLEMISTATGAQDDDVLSLLYRKVRSNCPDFKSHFHSVEQSLVVDVATVNLVFHQEAFITLNKYLQYIVHKFQSRDSLRARASSAFGGLRPSLESGRRRVRALWSGAEDPPIPQGATKFSYSTRATELRVRLCDTDLDFMDIRVTGLESDCLFKANERMVLRTYLTGITCEDLSDVTLYHRVLQVDDDRVLDLKYVRHAPRLYQKSGLAAGRDDDVKSDGSLKVRLGRLSLVLLYKTVVDLQQFVEPLLRPGLVPHWLALAGKVVDKAAGRLRTWPTRLHVSLDLHLPALLLPQKSASPNLVVANLGDLTVENFFKEMPPPSPDGAGSPLVIDNILVRLDAVQLSRAVMTLAGALHVQEPILEPLSLRLDIKRLKYLDYDVNLYSGVDGMEQDGVEETAGVFYCDASHQSQEVFSPVMRFPPDTISDLYKKITDLRLTVNVEGFEPIHVLCPKRSCHKLHALLPARNNIRYHIMMDVESTCQYRRVTIRSPLQIRNETTFSIGLYYKKSVFDALGLPHIGESTNPFDDSIFFMNLEPDKVCDVPLHVAYNCKIHFHPAYNPFCASESGLWWKDLGADMSTAKDFFCSAKDDKDLRAFSCRVVCSEGSPVKQTYRSIPNYMLRLLPPLQFYNGLPFAVELKVPSIAWEQRVEAGDRVSQYFLNLQKQHRVAVEVPAYLGLSWSGNFNLTSDLEEKTVTMTTEQDTEGGNKQLGVTVRVDRAGTCVVYLHSPYWIVNKTGLPLQIRGSLSDVVYDVPAEEALLFSFRKVRRRCARLRAYHSSWSSAFSLDTVDTNGLVVCRDRERRRHYRILQSVQLSSGCPQLTKIVTLLPNLIVYNRCRRPLRFMEENERADLWIDLAPDKCQPFWPVTDSMRMLVKYRDSKLVSQHFPVTQTHTTVLRMDRGTGLVVEVTGGGDMPFAVVFRSYSEGDAPLRVDNLCEDLFLKVHQQDLGQVALLSPYQSMLYTWDDPSRERCLLWNVYNKKSKGFVADFWKDGHGQERVCFHSVRQPPGSSSASSGSAAGSGTGGVASASSVGSAPTGVTSKLSAGLKLLAPKAPKQDGGSSSSDDTESDDLLRSQLKRTRRDKVVVYWVSYLEAHQRVLLFTQDERVSLSARKRIQSERSHLEAFLSLSGVGVSLMAPTASPASPAHGPTRELAYLSVTDSAAVWEVCMAHRWKPLSLELASWIEDKWRHDHKRAQMKEYVHLMQYKHALTALIRVQVDFEKMYMTKPFYGELRRRYNPAFWMQLRRSEHLTYCRMSIHRLQLDNQQPSAHFPTVLCPAPGSGAPAPAPAQAARRALLKPCVDLLVLRRARPAYRQNVYKYVKVVVQEFSVQLERDFLDALLASWAAATAPPGRPIPDDDQHRLLEGLRQDVARSYVPVHFLGVVSAEPEPEQRTRYFTGGK
ncbi:hypothetical protein FOCC_FOCC003192 [Frankliniella occidentalis]|nr:hypothetical protein FOCC_FOCC003192 [Frankliniella occidentalis]